MVDFVQSTSIAGSFLAILYNSMSTSNRHGIMCSAFEQNGICRSWITPLTLFSTCSVLFIVITQHITQYSYSLTHRQLDNQSSSAAITCKSMCLNALSTLLYLWMAKLVQIPVIFLKPGFGLRESLSKKFHSEYGWFQGQWMLILERIWNFFDQYTILVAISDHKFFRKNFLDSYTSMGSQSFEHL